MRNNAQINNLNKMNKANKSNKSSKSNNDDFVSDDVVSAGGDYMKFESGSNEFRAISKPIVGWIVWEEDDDGEKKPVRSAITDEPDAPSKDPKDKPKKFMTLVVIDRADDVVKILEITQQSVIKGIQGLARNEKWGSPFGYDINVEKKGADKKTRYTVTPSPKKPLSKQDIAAANEKPCNLDALYAGENPWETEDKEVTEYFFK